MNYVSERGGGVNNLWLRRVCVVNKVFVELRRYK